MTKVTQDVYSYNKSTSPDVGENPGTIFYTAVKGWLRYTVAKKYKRKLQSPE